MKPALFTYGSNPLGRFITLSILSLALITFDHRSQWTATLRAYLSNAVYPLRVAADAPQQGLNWASHSLSSRGELSQELQAQKATNRILAAQILQMQGLKAENNELRRLLQSSERLENEYSTARLLAVRMNPYQQRVIINRGDQNGLEGGMSIADKFGIMGRIAQAHAFHSEAMLISDPSHATPVKVLRNGVRSIAIGLGRTDRLQLQYLPVNTDIEVGDVIITSGLGGLFPPDFPVATVREISRDSHSPFAEIYAEPLADLDTTNDIIIARPKLYSGPSPDTTAAPDQAHAE